VSPDVDRKKMGAQEPALRRDRILSKRKDWWGTLLVLGAGDQYANTGRAGKGKLLVAEKKKREHSRGKEHNLR